MSNAERGRPDFLSNLDAVLKGYETSVGKTFKSVSALEIKRFTEDVRSHPESGELVEKLNTLKQESLKLLLIGENGKLVPKGSEYFPGSKALVAKGHEVKRLNNELETINYRNDVLSFVLSSNPDKLGSNFQKRVREAQKEYTFIKDAFGQLS